MRDGGGLVEHIAEGGGFIADTFVHLSGILSQLIGSEDLRRRVGAAGKDYVCRKYTYENMVQGYEQLYTSGQMRHVRH
jgi:glycosyltransferase involved in cell wall biosynthesis